MAFDNSQNGNRKSNDNIIRCILAPASIKVLVENSRQFMLAIQNESEVNSNGLAETRELIIREIQDHLADINHIGEVRLPDDSTVSHSINVALIATTIALKLSIKIDEIKKITLAGLVHDVGKVKIPPQLLYKTDKLSPKEQDLMKLHVPLGFKIARDELKLDQVICRIIMEHHEFYDGSGYPKALSGFDIHQYSQLISVANVYDNLATSYQPGRQRSCSEIVKEMLSMSACFNSQFLYTLIHMIKLNYKYSQV